MRGHFVFDELRVPECVRVYLFKRQKDVYAEPHSCKLLKCIRILFGKNVYVRFFFEQGGLIELIAIIAGFCHFKVYSDMAMVGVLVGVNMAYNLVVLVGYAKTNIIQAKND